MTSLPLVFDGHNDVLLRLANDTSPDPVGGFLKGGGPGYIQLIGSRRLSTDLGDAVERVNTEGKHGFAFDYRYDGDGHRDRCRSGHPSGP